MSSNSLGPVSPNGLAWEEAWKSVRRLAEARQSVAEGAAGSRGSSPSSPLVPDQSEDDILYISAQVQQDFAEIESASAALRKAQPDLEAWHAPRVEIVRTYKSSSVWLVIGAVWISTVLLMAMATFAIASLLR